MRLDLDDAIIASNAGSCMGRTCLHWGADGNLMAQDFKLVIERLALEDQEGNALRLRTLNREPCP